MLPYSRLQKGWDLVRPNLNDDIEELKNLMNSDFEKNELHFSFT